MVGVWLVYTFGFARLYETDWMGNEKDFSSFFERLDIIRQHGISSFKDKKFVKVWYIEKCPSHLAQFSCYNHEMHYSKFHDAVAYIRHLHKYSPTFPFFFYATCVTVNKTCSVLHFSALKLCAIVQCNLKLPLYMHYAFVGFMHLAFP